MKALLNPSTETLKHREENRKYYLKNRERLLVKSRLNYRKFKEWYSKYGQNKGQLERLEMLDILGSQCKNCGNDDWRVLQIDHINGGGSKERRGCKSPHEYRKKILNNLEKYQLLCANCNWIKKYENNENKQYE